MYEDFFGFIERPFELTPNTRYLYHAQPHETALRVIQYGVDRHAGFLVMTGEPGSGKTTTVRTLLNQIGENVATSLILNPLISNSEMIKSINRDFGIQCRSDSNQKQIEVLNEYLLKLNAEGRTALVVIDEAQNLSFDALEMTRMLSNLETETSKLINILLVGQPELEVMLSRPELRQLAQRIQIHAKLKPLTYDETNRYIMHRVHLAGNGPVALFDRGAVKRIYKKSGGVPRLINNICELGLLMAYCRNTRVIDKQIIAEAIREVPGYVSHT